MRQPPGSRAEVSFMLAPHSLRVALRIVLYGARERRDAIPDAVPRRPRSGLSRNRCPGRRDGLPRAGGSDRPANAFRLHGRGRAPVTARRSGRRRRTTRATTWWHRMRGWRRLTRPAERRYINRRTGVAPGDRASAASRVRGARRPRLDTILQLILNGLAVGCIYGLVALGFVLIYKATELVNFAQGDLLMLGAFTCYMF